MISFVEGTVAELGESNVVIQVGGFGIELLAPTSTLAKCEPGQKIKLRTKLIVRDEQPTLYGFHHDDQIIVFTRLLDVTGVGPKVALSVLSTLPVSLIVTAVTTEDPALLTAAPGVGKRTAERIVLELGGRLPDQLLANASATGRGRVLAGASEDAVAALLSLGYREAQVKSAVAELAAAEPTDDAEALIKKALAKLR